MTGQPQCWLQSAALTGMSTSWTRYIPAQTELSARRSRTIALMHFLHGAAIYCRCRVGYTHTHTQAESHRLLSACAFSPAA